MKLATFAIDGRHSWGAVEGDEVIDLGGLSFAGLRALLAADALDQARAAIPTAPRLPIGAITWPPLIADPAKILCIGLNYETHRKETGRDATARPAVFTRYADTLIGYGADIERGCLVNGIGDEA